MMLRILFLSCAFGVASSCFGASEEGFARSFTVSDADNALRLTSGAFGDVATDSFAISEIDAPILLGESLGNDLFEVSQLATSQVFSKSRKVLLSEEGIIPLGDGKVLVASLGAIVDERRIAESGNWRMPVSKTMSLGIITLILLIGAIVRKRATAI